MMPKAPVFKRSSGAGDKAVYGVYTREKETQIDVKAKFDREILTALIRMKPNCQYFFIHLNTKYMNDDQIESWRLYGEQFIRSEGFVLTDSSVTYGLDDIHVFHYRIDYDKSMEQVETEIAALQLEKKSAAPKDEEKPQTYECKICSMTKDEFVVTGCGHVMCSPCCEKLGSEEGTTRQVKCPFCNEKTPCRKLFL